MQKYFTFFIALFISSLALSDLTNPPKSIEKQYFTNINQLSNGGFELGKEGWSSGISITSTSGLYKEGARGAAWDPSGSGTISSPCWTTNQDTAVNGLARLWVKTADADYDFQVYNSTGTAVVAEVDVPASSDLFTEVQINFVAAESTTYCMRLEAQGDESIIYLDDGYLGEAYNLSQVSQASLYGTSVTAGTTSCAWSITQTTYAADFPADTDCPAPTVTGGLTAPATKVPQIVMSNHPAGVYEVTFSVPVLTSAAAENAACRLVDSDGTLLVSSGIRQASGGQFTVSLTGAVTYQNDGSHDIKFQCLSGSGSVETATGLVQRNATWTVKRFPLASQLVTSNSSTASFWSGYHSSDCNFIRTNTAFGAFTADSTCTFTERQNGNFGSVTSELSGSDPLPGIVFTPKALGTYIVLANASCQVTSSGQNAALQLTDGTTVIANQNFSNAGSYFTDCHVIGLYNATSLNAVTFRLYGKVASGNIVLNGGDSSVEWSIVPVGSFNKVSVMNQVSTDYSSGINTNSAKLNCDAGSSIMSQLGSWVSSIGNVSGGACTVTLASGMYSSTPYCFAQLSDSDFATTVGNLNVIESSATSISVDCTTSDTPTACSAYDFNLQCVGPR